MESEIRRRPDGRQVRAIGLYSGGLDSLLAARTLLDQGIDVICFHADIGFDGGSRRWFALSGRPDPPGRIIEERIDLGAGRTAPLLKVDLREAYRETLLNPRHGYGGNLNPCIDCHAFMARTAGELMREREADFIFTGEVLGQRPMSQQRRGIDLVEKDSGLAGRLLRPLSALALPETPLEREGLVDRARLHGFQGRTRKPQLDLARRLGIVDFPSPAGGCLLTEPVFASRLWDLIAHLPAGAWPEEAEIVLLKVGRHLRIAPDARLVIGRDESENALLRRLLPDATWLEAEEVPGPVALLLGEAADPAASTLAAAAVARYGKGRAETRVTVRLRRGDGDEGEVMEVEPAAEATLAVWRISQTFKPRARR